MCRPRAVNYINYIQRSNYSLVQFSPVQYEATVLYLRALSSETATQKSTDPESSSCNAPFNLVDIIRDRNPSQSFASGRAVPGQAGPLLVF